MKFKGTIIITDPCYIMRAEHHGTTPITDDDWRACNYGQNMEALGITLDADEVRKAIEAAVYEVNRELHDEKLKESQLQNTNPVPSNDKIDNTGNVIPDEDTVTEEAVG